MDDRDGHGRDKGREDRRGADREDAARVVPSAGPADLVATVWFRLGYKPRDSLVMVGLSGPRNRAGLILRSDLPPTDDPEALSYLVADSLGSVLTAGADAVVALVIQDGVLCRPRPAIIGVLAHRTERLRVPLTDVVGVTATSFASLLCPDEECCPVGGRPIAEVMSSRAAAAHLALGDRVLDDEAEIIADVLGPPRSGDEAGPGPAGPPRIPMRRRDRESWWERWRRACGSADVPPRRDVVVPDTLVQGLSRALHDPLLRDAVLMDVLGAPAGPVRAMLHGGDAWDADLGLTDLLGRAPSPDPHRPAPAVLAAAIRTARSGDRAPALAVLAMLAWYEGKGGRARLLVEQARADSSEVSLTRLVGDLLVRQLPPPWHANR